MVKAGSDREPLAQAGRVASVLGCMGSLKSVGSSSGVKRALPDAHTSPTFTSLSDSVCDRSAVIRASSSMKTNQYEPSGEPPKVEPQPVINFATQRQTSRATRLLKGFIRILIAGDILCIVFSVWVSHYSSLPEPLHAYKEGLIPAHSSLMLGLGTPVMLVWLISRIGLFAFWRPARMLYLVAEVSVLLLTPSLDNPHIASGWSQMFQDAEGLLSGCVLALVYCSPVRHLFRLQQSQPNTPTDITIPKVQRSWFRFRLWTLLVLVVICSIPCIWFAVKMQQASREKNIGDKPDAQVAQKFRVLVTISRETTYITEPLRKDGYPDYVAALDQQFSAGVTPENNAAVLFWKALGSEEIRPEYRDKYFQMLGIPPLPEKGDYFVDFDKYGTRQKNNMNPRDAKPEAGTQENTWDQLRLAMRQPWSQQGFPVLAEWLAANEKPLALVVEASKHPRRYDPLCCRERIPLIAVLLPAIQGYRNVARALCARAMLRLHAGKLDEAWEELLACHRLARLAGQGPTVVEAFVALSIEETACVADEALLQHADLTATQVAKMREDLDRLPPMLKMANKLDIAERCTYLNNVSDFARQGPASLAGFDRVAELKELNGSKELKNTIKSLIHYSASTAIDWDLILRMGNSWYDRITDAYRKPTRAEQKEALSKVDEDIRRLKKTAEDAASLDKLMLGNPRKALSERLSQVLLTMFLPQIPTCIQVEDRGIMRFELDKLAFALASYRADHGAYPAKLADLTPKYVLEVPTDIFNDHDLNYRREGKGYLLYSFGINGKDDGAKSYDDRKKDEDWDDIVVRVPAPTMEKKKP